MWKNQLGFLIHPKIEINVEPDQLSIAEFGTGTGVWLLDLAKKLHAPVRLDGFDVDVSLVPPPQWLPKNVTIRALGNYTDKLPEHMIQAYDIVRVANIASTVKDNNPGDVVKNVMAMLKPNGYIQWHEPDTAHRHILLSTPNHNHPQTTGATTTAAIPTPTPNPTPHLSTLLRFLSDNEASSSPRGWIDSLPDILTRYGLEAVRAGHRFRMPDAYVEVET
ncbi:MAG: hypothetical protein Q9216_007078, partial [Gyalolechia sp. 2 TL-2023]